MGTLAEKMIWGSKKISDTMEWHLSRHGNNGFEPPLRHTGRKRRDRAIIYLSRDTKGEPNNLYSYEKGRIRLKQTQKRGKITQNKKEKQTKR